MSWNKIYDCERSSSLYYTDTIITMGEDWEVKEKVNSKLRAAVLTLGLVDKGKPINTDDVRRRLTYFGMYQLEDLAEVLTEKQLKKVVEKVGEKYELELNQESKKANRDEK